MLLQSLLAGTEALARRFGSWRISEATGTWMTTGNTSAAGVQVTEEGALSLSAVFSAVNLLSTVKAALPLAVYRRQGRERLPATSHPAYKVLAGSPNPEMTSFTFRKALEFNRLLRGAAVAEIQWSGSGVVSSLWPIETYRVEPKREDTGRLYYKVDGKRDLPAEDLLYIPLVSADGVCGRSFLDYAMESVGLGIAKQNHAATYFGNGARPGVILRHPSTPPEAARKEMRRGWDERHKGPNRAHGTAVLWGGWEFVGSDGAVDPEKSQLLEALRFTAEEVARWLNIPPHLLGELSRATFANIEEQGLNFLMYCLGPIITAYEQEYDRRLLSPPALYAKHDVRGLLRGNAAARSAYFREMWNIGALSQNEIREIEDENPIPGGDTHFVPLNMVPLDRALNPPQPGDVGPPPAGEDDPGPDDPPTPPAGDGQPTPAPSPMPPVGPKSYQQDARPALERLLASTLARLARVEANAILRAAAKPGQFLTWLEEFYPKHEATLGDALAPVLSTCGELLGATDYVPSPDFLAGLWCRRSREVLLDLSGRCTPPQLRDGCESLIRDYWHRAESLARDAFGGDHADNP